MMFSALVVALIAQAPTQSLPSPEGKDAARAYVGAVQCASDFVDRSSFNRDQIERISREALADCEVKKEEAVQKLIKAMPGSDAVIALENVEARMKIAAGDRLITRLERGDYRMPDRDKDPTAFLSEPVGRLAYCFRIAINRKLDGLGLGESAWLLDLRERTDEEKLVAFSEIGQRSCVLSMAAYSTAYERAVRDRDIRSVVEKRFSLPAIRAMVIKPYLQVVPPR